jgi:heterodisulfide reductase subunit C
MKSTNHVPGFLPEKEQQLRKTFLEEASRVPGGDRISQCIQCGTCTGSCPVSYAMDISPRMVIALFRAGAIERILASRTIWICASCYMCTTRCPQGIKVTDILYALKRTAMTSEVYPDRFPVYRLSKSFVALIRRYGRNHEMQLLLRYYLKRNPFALLRMLPLALAMLKRGRIAILPSKVKGIDQIREILSASESMQLPQKEEPVDYEDGVVGYGAVDSVAPRKSA